ncbi:hypothetical protein [Streptomyces sp. NPDC056821]|uniref:hypothetical protein n=1 Tax=Streptomyces sp. NPDC056821 TaxID=3345952 RepID=UPI00368C50B8
MVQLPAGLAAFSWRSVAVRVTEAVAVLPATSVALRANWVEVAALAVVAQLVAELVRDAAEGEVAAWERRPLSSAAFQVRVCQMNGSGP